MIRLVIVNRLLTVFFISNCRGALVTSGSGMVVSTGNQYIRDMVSRPTRCWYLIQFYFSTSVSTFVVILAIDSRSPSCLRRYSKRGRASDFVNNYVGYVLSCWYVLKLDGNRAKWPTFAIQWKELGKDRFFSGDASACILYSSSNYWCFYFVLSWFELSKFRM